MLKKKDKLSLISVSVSVLVLFIIIISSANAYQVDEDTTIMTLGGDFNYTFAEQMNFSIIAWYSDRVMLNYTNISIIPYSGTGNATIRNVTTELINYTLCGQNQNVNMSYQNISSHMVVDIPDDVTYYQAYNDTNYTVNATSACKTVTVISDTTAPNTMTFQGSTPANSTQIDLTDRIDINISFTETYDDTCLLNWSGSAANITMTIDKINNQCTYTFGNLADATYTYYVWLNDSGTNSNVTETRTVIMNNALWLNQYPPGSPAGAAAGGAVYIPPVVQDTEPQNISQDILNETLVYVYVLEERKNWDALMYWVTQFANSPVLELPRCKDNATITNLEVMPDGTEAQIIECEHDVIAGIWILAIAGLAGMYAVFRMILWGINKIV